MFDHIGLRTEKLAALSQFYKAALAPLGLARAVEYEGGLGLGGAEGPGLWINEGAPASAVHIALSAPSRAAVDAFHAAALGAGGRDNGAPGLRKDYAPTYYAAFVIDPDGNNVEAVCT